MISLMKYFKTYLLAGNYEILRIQFKKSKEIAKKKKPKKTLIRKKYKNKQIIF